MSATTSPTINTYISDMIALEKHIAQPLEQQASDGDVQALPAAIRVVRETLDTTNRRISKLESRLAAVGGHAGSPAKDVVAASSGVVAGVINKLRKTEVSKGLRDDYTALSLASAGYTMLHTTAMGLHDAQTADLAKDHLTDVATAIMKINRVLPVAVLAELQDEGVSVDAALSASAERDSEEAWAEAGKNTQTSA